MAHSRKRDLSLAVLVAAVVAAGGMVPLYRHYHPEHAPAGNQAAKASAPAASGATAPATAAPGTAETETEAAAPPAPPGTELVPAEEAENDHGPGSGAGAAPAISVARAAGLHLKPDPMRLGSSVALVVDRDTGQTLLSKNEDAVLPIASLTKLMTTLLVTEAKQPMDEVLTITQDDVDTERHSKSRLRPGTTLTREEALHLALMSSENRAAHALGRSYPGGLTKMVEAMNARAKALGMKNTTYVDPTGLSNRNRSTARDLSILVSEAVKNPLLREFSTDPAHLATLGGRTLQYRNSDALVRNSRSGWEIELQKTGYIVEAGRCLTLATKVAGHDLVMVLLDADSNNGRVADAQRMRRWVVSQNNWQDSNFAVARAEPPRHAATKVNVARNEVKQVGAKGKTVVAKGKTVVAKNNARSRRKQARSEVAATKKSPAVAKGKEGRVHQTFTARHSARDKEEEKSKKT
ncbi:MAG: D-alanyl-D-alanine endopeptidase [Ramlibacter sp.]|nr:D-alanyl-D-alanine endopeptidase [Ramlibacter sp.]